jgi:acyl carrier protein
MKNNIDRLKKVFENTFEIEENKIEAATINNTRNWNSLSHMNLIIAISDEFPNRTIPDSYFPKLISFKAIIKFLNRKTKS